MPRPDPALLDPARYPFSITIDPRYGDLDINRHINNVALSGMFEDGRVRFHRACGYLDAIAGWSSMIVSSAIEYLGEGQYPEALTFYCAIEELGRSSHRLAQFAVQGDRPIAFARNVMVAVGPDGPAALPAEFVQHARQWGLKA